MALGAGDGFIAIFLGAKQGDFVMAFFALVII
jgi:hypothetical protein